MTKPDWPKRRQPRTRESNASLATMMDDSQDSGARPAPVATGKALVLTMIGVAIMAASFAWWWNYNRGRRALEYYGAGAATLIRTAPRVEILRPEPESDIDISSAPGLLNARASLLSDAAYDWNAAAPQQESPLFSVRFSRGERSVIVTFDFENRTIRNSATQRTIVLVPKTADGWRQYLARRIEAQQAKSAPQP